ncbi:unnamed protein product [Schistosoma mattheei]|uniref:Uncharacterized protein n=1 Tax=Schistosoma mattheei TaxID=31246 RepID=A0A183PQK7_9TREM|nr:unnamed protein product [Schistosoma mattheei]
MCSKHCLCFGERLSDVDVSHGVLGKDDRLIDIIVPIEPTSEEKSRMYPPYEWSAKKGLIIKPNLDRDSYLIRRSDTPGLYWRVHLAKSSKTEQDSETVS